MNHQFRKDLKEGHDFEDSICEFVQIKYPQAHRIKGYFKGFDIFVPEKNHKIECKFDRMSAKTPNVAIEFECNNAPSGISLKDATHWIVKFYHDKYKDWRLAIGRVEVWRELCEGQRVVSGGDGWRAKMYLVPKELLKRKGIKIRLPI